MLIDTLCAEYRQLAHKLGLTEEQIQHDIWYFCDGDDPVDRATRFVTKARIVLEHRMSEKLK